MSDSIELRQLVEQNQIPAVFLLSADESGSVHQINIDDYHASREMTEFLISNGHTKIGFIKGDKSQSVSKQRLQGFRDACKAANIDVQKDYIQSGRFTYQSGQKAALKLLSLPSPPSAIFASNDDMAAGAIAAAAQLSLSVPNDIAIAGFDDSPIATIVAPPLTTIRQPVAEMAKQAVRAIMDTGAHSGTPLVELATHEIVKRGST